MDCPTLPEVMMDENIAKARDLTPLDLGVPQCQLLREPLDCLTDHFEISNHSIETQLVVTQTNFIEASDVGADSPDGL